MIVIDGLENILPTNKQKRLGKAKFYDLISRTLKEIAVKQKLVVFLVSTLKRELDYRKSKWPIVSDLHGGPYLQNNVDSILLLYRPCLYDPKEDDELAYVVIAKNNQNPYKVI